MTTITTPSSLALVPSLKTAWQDVDSSFERFCLTAGIGAIEQMPCEDAQQLAGTPHNRGGGRVGHRWGRTKGKIAATIRVPKKSPARGRLEVDGVRHLRLLSHLHPNPPTVHSVLRPSVAPGRAVSNRDALSRGGFPRRPGIPAKPTRA
jgi:hypothetical protein